jgi:hypothetical protein
MKRGELILLLGIAIIIAACVTTVADHWSGIQSALRGFALREMGDVEPAHVIHRSHPNHHGHDENEPHHDCEPRELYSPAAHYNIRPALSAQVIDVSLIGKKGDE